MVDSGIYSLNYHDYADNSIAIQREYEIGDNLNENEYFIDPDFPPNSRSLYFDPLNPPKGAIPNESIKWLSICKGDVIDCDYPIYSNYDNESPLIEQGALGNKYFINALRIICSNPEFIKRILVSDKFASKGLYTLKFCKAGKWRYIHIDDNIPCRQSGKVNFCRNKNSNELFAMLIEKAYAKLHGCYEAIAYGLVEKVLHDLCYTSSECLRFDMIPIQNRCDQVWDILEKSIESKQLVGCLRTVPDPYTENPTKRKGITLHMMYEVVDLYITSAEPTEDLDGITVGLVCVRILQIEYVGKFNGRWCFGNRLWHDYKEIALDVRGKTREIQFKRGLGKDPNIEDNFNDKGMGGIERILDEINKASNDYEDDEPDDISNFSDYKRSTIKMVQPMADDLFWIQIEDFVEVFNRVYLVNDFTTIYPKEGTTKRFVSKWIPGDNIGGSGGPPILITAQTAVPPNKQQQQQQQQGDQSAVVLNNNDIGINNNKDVSSNEQKNNDNNNQPLTTINNNNNTNPVLVTNNQIANISNNNEINDNNPIISSTLYDVNNNNGNMNILERYAYINEKFNTNPMYPFSVNEKTTISISLYQKDKRWSDSRLGEQVQNIPLKVFAIRSKRLQSCMEYQYGIAFIIIRLSGLKVRLSEFKLKKVVACSEGIVFSNVASKIIHLLPGRYAIIPYTHSVLNASMEYVIHCNYLTGQIDFEIEDVLEQRLIDDIPSDDEIDEDYEPEPDDNDLLHLHEGTDDVSIMSYERVKIIDSDVDEDDLLNNNTNDDDEDNKDNEDENSSIVRQRAAAKAKVPPPKVLLYKTWEYNEDTEELGIKQIFGEVGEVMKYVTTLRKEIRILNSEVNKIKNIPLIIPENNRKTMMDNKEQNIGKKKSFKK